MTVYYYDLFTGTAGTLLTSHTADSGATWPDDANHLDEYNSIQLDGNGAVFLEGTQPTLEIPSATQPSSQNFEVLFTFKRLSALSGSSSGVELLRQAPFTGSAEDYAFVYNEGSGFTFLHSGLPVGDYAAGPAVETLWYLKVDVSTSGDNTSFASYYSTTSGGPWTALTNYSVATPSDAVAAGLRFTGTSATTTTGHHIGALTVQDIGTLSSAKLAGTAQQLYSTPAEFTVGLNEVAGTGGITVTLSSSNGSDTFQATKGGSNLSPKQITIAAGSINGTFWLTPSSTGTRNISITTSPTLSYIDSPFTYDALTTATGYTVTGASGGHQLVPETWTVTLVGGDFNGTITATPGNVLTGTASLTSGSTTVTGSGTAFLTQIVVGVTYTFGSTPYTVASVQSNTQLTLSAAATANASGVTIKSGQAAIYAPGICTFIGNGTLAQTFTFTPYSADTVIFTFTNSGNLSNVGNMTFLATRMYFLDQFLGSSGTSISGWDSNALPAVAAAGYTVTGSIELDGNGMTFMSSGSSAQAMSLATLPTFNPASSVLEFLFEIEQMSNIASNGGIVMMSSTGNVMTIQLSYSGTPEFYVEFGGTIDPNANTTINVPAVGTRWYIKVDCIGVNVDTLDIYTYYSTDGINWNQLTTSSTQPIGIYPPQLPTTFAVGPYFSGVAGTETTGVHVGNIVVQDISPASPNCQISNAYVTSSGQSAMLFYETISGNTPVYPSALNYPLTFFQNGTLINPAEVTYWIGSGALCAGVLFPPGVQVYATDAVTMLAPASAVALGQGYASAAVSTPLTLTNNGPTSSAALGSGKSCFGTDTLVKTLRPGYNIGYCSVNIQNPYTIFANLRYRQSSGPFASYTQDGYPAGVSRNVGIDFVDLSGPNAIDNTNYPVVAGYYAVGYDDLAYGTSNQCNITLAATYFSTMSSTVTQVTSCNNPGTNGIGQFYLFDVQPISGSGTANISFSLVYTMPNGGTATQLQNVYVLGPGDFTVPSLTNTSWSFPRPAPPGPLSWIWTENFFKNGCGSMRWVDGLLGQGTSGNTQVTEPWEMHELYDYSWDVQQFWPAVTVTTARAFSSGYIYSDFFGSSWSPQTSSSVAVTLGANMTGLTAGSGTVSVAPGQTTITFSTSQSGLTGLAFIGEGEATGTYNNLITGGSGTTWTLAFPFKGPANAAATWSTLQSTLTLSAVPQAGDAPFYGIMLQIDSEYMRCVGYSGTTVNVVRAQVWNQTPSVAAAHSSGATITCGNRLAMSGLPLSYTPNCQWVEMVTSTPHNLKSCLQIGQNSGTIPTMTCTDGTVLNSWPGSDICFVWPTGQYTFLIDFGAQGSSSAVTLGPSTAYPSAPTSYTLSGVTIQNPAPNAGVPHEAVAIATGAIPGCDLYINMPANASDSYCYNAAIKVLNNFPAGRRVYVELDDEPWNFGAPIYYQKNWYNEFLGYSDVNGWYAVRAGQIRSVWKTVFGSRSSEIYMGVGVWTVYAANQPMIPSLTEHNVIVDAYFIAPYISPTASTQATPISTASWNAANITQMADLFIHDVWHNPLNTTGFVGPQDGSVAGTHWNAIATYNAWLDANHPGTRHMVLVGYEGDYSIGAPDTCTTCSSGVNYGFDSAQGFGNITPYLNHDIQYDPVWRIYEKDYFALLQNLGFSNINNQSIIIYYFYEMAWGTFYWGAQPTGKGDGSDGKANNRHCLATPGYPYTKAATTNQDATNVSVRGQALAEWMQPAQDKKRMLFVPYRFVNR